MKKENAIRYYRKFSGADAYILGFVYKHDLYCITVDEIMPRFMRVEKSSSRPNFNALNYKDYSTEVLNRNLPIWATYEPGSTLKNVTPLFSNFILKL